MTEPRKSIEATDNDDDDVDEDDDDNDDDDEYKYETDEEKRKHNSSQIVCNHFGNGKKVKYFNFCIHRKTIRIRETKKIAL